MFRLLRRIARIHSHCSGCSLAVDRAMKIQRPFYPTLALLTFICSGSIASTTSTATPPVGTAAKKSKAPPKTAAKKNSTARPAAAKTAPGGTPSTRTPLAGKSPVRPAVTTRSSLTRSPQAKPAVARTHAAIVPASRTVLRRRVNTWVQTWDEPTFKDSTDGDSVEGEDLEVRKAAVEALGPYNGSIVVVDPNTGRILSMVNQRLALGGGFQPCSTIKVSVALAALHEGILKQSSLVRLTRRSPLDLTEAIAHSNNYFFANLGIKLGYDKVSS